jgi:carboxylesterase type B
VEPVPVPTRSGAVAGVRQQDGTSVWRGIPYAAAIDGTRRFQLPEPAPAWTGVRDASRFGAAPPQVPIGPGAPEIWTPADGLDCLSVNVWSPDPNAVLPVLVWIYGGAWKIGAGSQPGYDGARLAAAGTVVVTFNYRVGFEGFGLLPGAPNNRAMHDQIAALRWVRDNIAGFGGDPDRVTIFGESAGAGSAAILMGTPAAHGLFRRAILQSVPGDFRGPEEAERVTGIIADAAGVPPTLAGLAGLPPAAILAVQDKPLTGPGGRGITAFGPVIDGDLVTGQAWAGAPAAAAAGIEVIAGFMHDEYRLFAPGGAPPGLDLAEVAAALGLDGAAVAAYRAAYPEQRDPDLFVTLLSDALFRIPTTWVADEHARAGGRTWLYDFTWRSPVLGAAVHSMDIPFTFGRFETAPAVRMLGDPPPAAAVALGAAIQDDWTRFAATGDPQWTRYEPGGRTRIWADPVTETDYPIPASREIWSAVGP